MRLLLTESSATQLVDPDLGKSLSHLQEYVSAKEALEADEAQVCSALFSEIDIVMLTSQHDHTE